ncbi:Protein CTR9-like [Vitis vinifera]|uniref:Protein CTR9-like n=1 Tax=Vitis vinifera TaxID=29760 RepID=A0A438E8S9_VITVI|nr:Protein CTR9-like [Vitis vinifera]
MILYEHKLDIATNFGFTFVKRALQVYPDCPAAVRVGIGLCCYKLGQFEKARKAFQRVFAVEQLTETALAVTNHGPTKSHSYYNLARSYHSKGDYEKAGLYYMASVKESNKPHDFVLPYYGLGQVQLKLGDFRSSLSNFEKVLEVYPENCEALKALGHIYVQLGQTEKAQEYLRKATKIDPHEITFKRRLTQLVHRPLEINPFIFMIWFLSKDGCLKNVHQNGVDVVDASGICS